VRSDHVGAAVPRLQSLHFGHDALGLLAGVRAAALVVDRKKSQAGAERRPALRAARPGLQPALVELLGDVRADVRVQAIRSLEEEAAIGRDRRVPVERCWDETPDSLG
jgi:hypothetical protein